MILYILNFVVLLCILSKTCSSSCIQSCGEGAAQKHVPYPFGFSPDCQIQLSCGPTGAILVGGFEVKNLTDEYVIVKLPVECNRRVDETLRQLWSRNYAITSRTELLLDNCTSSSKGGADERCTTTDDLIRTRFRPCGYNGNIICCYSNKENQFLNHTSDELNQQQQQQQRGSSCSTLLSSVVSRNDTEIVSFEFQTLELGWWLEQRPGQWCNCSDHAECTEVVSPFDGRLGFRCRCRDGFDGDGFAAGQRCRRSKASPKCTASNYISGQCGGSTGNRIGFLIGGVIGGASSMLGLALICYLIRRKRSSLRSRKSARHLIAEAAGSYHVPFYSYKEIERATSCFSERHRIGTGAYGTVYAGKLNNVEWVAIKKIRHREAEGIEQVMNEIKLLSSVHHPNLVRLLGCCIEKDEQILVYEFMPNGTLSQHLQKERGTGLPWSVRLDIATETAQAIAHLHSAENPIYHRDIKSSNILLDYDFKSKVADFGLSRLGFTELSHISTAPQGTPGYLDPQYHQNFHLSDKSDVYSFGVVLVEIVTGLKAVDFSRSNSQVNLATLAVEKIGKGCVEDIMDPSLEPHTDAWTLSSVHKVAELAFRCLAFHRDMRPSMMEVVAELECIRLSSMGPSEENEYLGSSFSTQSVASAKSQNLSTKKVGLGSRRLVVPFKNSTMISLDEIEDTSPVSVQVPWCSEQSSPSADSLLNNATN